MRLTDLLTHPSFGLELVSGHDAVSDRKVLGAHALEVGDPLRWIPPDWILLTTGLRLYRKPAEQRRLVGDLAKGGLTALGFGVGVVFDEPPAALVDEARKMGFPVFTVPVDTLFRDIIRLIDQDMLREDMDSLRQAVSILDVLVEGLTDPQPERAVVKRLGRVLRGPATLYDAAGHVLTSTASAPDAEQWLSLAHSVAHEGETVQVSNHIATPVLCDSLPVRWLVVTTGESTLDSELAVRAVRQAAALLSAVESSRSAQHRAAQAQATALLRELTGVAPCDEPSAWQERALALGVDLREPWMIALATWPEGGSGDPCDLVDEMVTRLRWRRMPHLSMEAGGAAVALVPAGCQPMDLLTPATSAKAVLALGSVVRSEHDVARSYRAASMSSERGRRLGPGSCVRHDELRLTDWLLLGADASEAVERAEALISPLRDHPDIYSTLVLYLSLDKDPGRTAERLFIHKNSLRYRLARAESLLGLSLQSVADVAELYSALLLSEAAGPGHGDGPG